MKGRTPEEAISPIKDICDFSNLPKHHPLYSEKNKSTIGYFKDELKMSKVVLEACLIRSKCYSLKLSDWGVGSEVETINKCKGVRRNIVKAIPFESYKAVLTNISSQTGFQTVIKAANHSVYTVVQQKTMFSSFDDKVFLKYNTYIYSVYDIIKSNICFP